MISPALRGLFRREAGVLIEVECDDDDEEDDDDEDKSPAFRLPLVRMAVAVFTAAVMFNNIYIDR